MKLKQIVTGIAALGVATALPVMADCGNCEADGHKKSDSAMSSSHKHHKDKDATAMSQSSSHDSAAQAVRLSKVMDAKVTSQDGKNLGELEDIVIDAQTGKIKFGVLGYGGVLGIGEDRIPVPWEQVSFDSEKQQFTLNVDQERLASAPKFDKDYSELNDPSFSTRISEFYSGSEAVGGSDDLENPPSTSSESTDDSEDMESLPESQSSSSSESSDRSAY